MESIKQMNDDFFNFSPPFNEEKTIEPGNEFIKYHKEAYFSIIKTFQALCLELKAGKTADGNPLRNEINGIIKFFKEDERMLLGMANAPYSYILRNLDEEVFGIIVIHGINVMIYSLKISIELGVPDIRLPYICAASLFHRLGLLEMSNEKLISPAIDKGLLNEIDAYDKAPEKYISRISIDDFHIESIQYLITLVKEDQQILQKTSLREAMYQYSMVIHLCHDFEKLTHQAGYGEIMSPVDAMKKMRDDMADYFHPEIVKIFSLSVEVKIFLQLSEK